jgi:peptidoglycan/LPS O-acetylase OafA/YrhL
MVVGAPAATSAAYLAHLAAYLAATFLLSHLLLAYFDEPLRARLALRAATTRPSR